MLLLRETLLPQSLLAAAAAATSSKKKIKQYYVTYVELQLYKLILIPSAVIKNIERSLGTHNDLHFVHSSQHLCDTVTRIAPEIRVKKS